MLAGDANEQACSLDAGPATGLTDGNGAENPQVTAGTLVPGKPTTPWITWDESSTSGGPHSVFVARLDPAGDHFDLLNNGQPISHSGLDSTRPDIAFAGNTPYVSWHETDSTGKTGQLRRPLRGQPCQPGPQQLFAQAYTPGTVQTGGASGITDSSANVAGQVDTDGARTLVHFDYGTTAGYGASTPGQLLAPTSGARIPFSGALTGLPAGTTIHYRAVAQTDFGTVDGQDQILQTTSSPPSPAVALLASGTATVTNGVAAVKVVSRGISGQRCGGRLTLSLVCECSSAAIATDTT